MYRIYNCNCISGSKKYLKDKTVNLMVCDPPFGIQESLMDKHYNREASHIIEGYQESPSDYYDFSFQWLKEAQRVLKDDGSLYIISGWNHLIDIMKVCDGLGMHLINHIIWKYNFGVCTSRKFVSSHYHILYLKKSSKSKVTFNTYCRYSQFEKEQSGKSSLYIDLEDVWHINKEYQQGGNKNQNKLPEKLLEKIILYSSNEGDIVCDFFLGNFTTAIVAKKLNRIPYGFEINSNAFDISIKKLGEVDTGSRLRELPIIENACPKNQGKRISSEEIDVIRKDYDHMLSSGEIKTKKEAIEKLCIKYQRGRFSIGNILKGTIIL